MTSVGRFPPSISSVLSLFSFRCAEHVDIPSGCYLYLPPGEECCKSLACNETITNPQVTNSHNIRQNHIVTNPKKSEILISNTSSEPGNSIRERHKSAIAYYENILKNLKGATDINSYLFHRTVQYNVDPKANANDKNDNLIDSNRLLIDFFSRYGSLSFFGAKNQRRSRRNLRNAKPASPQKYHSAELSKTLEITDYLLEYRASQNQQSQRKDGKPVVT